MDWKTLFLAPDGRIGRKDFWIGTAVLFVANLVVAWIPGLGLVAHLASIYVGVCLSSKRLHDMGYSGWLSALPYIVWALAVVAIVVTSGAAVIAAIFSGSQGALATGLGALGLIGLLASVSALFGTAFLLWIGLMPPQAGDNRFGPAPVRLVTAF